MTTIYLPLEEFVHKNRFFYNRYTTEQEYMYHDQLQYHDFYELQFFFNAAESQSELLGYITLDSVKYPLYHNCIAAVDLFKKHRMDIISPNYIRYCLDIPSEIIYFACTKESNLLNLFGNAGKAKPIMRMTPEQGKSILESFSRISENTLENGADIFQKGELLILLAKVFDYCYTKDFASSGRSDKNHQLIIQLVEYIDTHIENPLSLEELSEALHFSTYYLSHAFKNHTDISLKKYILDKKIELAKQLLELHPTTEVAERIGFQNYSSFFRAFKKLTGLSPSEYRDSIADGR